MIYNGVDLEHFHPGLRDEHRQRCAQNSVFAETAPVILFVGSGFERKGVPMLLRALAAMQRKDAQLVVVGKDRQQKLAEMLAQTLGVDERVHFLGGQQDVRPYYGAADVFCLPTLYDPFPNAALEALACGLPLVTTTTCGAPELIAASPCGYYCSAGDVDALARLLAQSVASAHLPAVREKAREIVLPLAAGKAADKLAMLYKTLLGQ